MYISKTVELDALQYYVRFQYCMELFRRYIF